ncbi:2-dehydro-3-deoxyphosphogluconate aldolase, 4-hydroxy-2-oxoglutarate aldolase [Cyanidioschyzon merolae strain 10D]|uniref:2-dehydro-3-deoxyphosphogluconate aldolase, 4-hydroxy-2-oxoglutarate aldolase n=1 Tax=Cyanidioschyzon merolae (strain NIES-3377 / 10D) TaxID=280699 RepID=M1VKA2_CYAM1|nr:2-dehydro-3-deoxyphosphogluconate aldolase, 4-hydroxy-2-oxoglutarate aldolase [Cyanidioschyzon merolae strain 10D]BAM81893.1 2-dehydro-3-deoxyphosphogluconate aldolase, 4-hydroxy-2-oxoglutarate aldolase [Cyanidioschyzon merolae strain 10D]|eukprot:XP_005537929.1 2-dehydro-3-deoxyphosphogluconate aldolase, 4-hydroxy-2-oxoglutarate aldolase [Cyanidioschyzon merolae strain 10D]
MDGHEYSQLASKIPCFLTNMHGFLSIHDLPQQQLRFTRQRERQWRLAAAACRTCTRLTWPPRYATQRTRTATLMATFDVPTRSFPVPEKTRTYLRRQPLIVCIRLKSFILDQYAGARDALEAQRKRLLTLAAGHGVELTDQESQTAAMIIQIVETLQNAGLHNFEITMDMPGVEWALRYLHETRGTSILLGAGTVLHASQLERAIACGCRFTMSPVFLPGRSEQLIAYAREHNVLFIPGAATPSECVQASLALGEYQPVKVFPADVVGGLRFIRALAGPLSHIPLIPTSGVTFDVVEDYLSADNVYAVGVSQQILPTSRLLAGDWPQIHRLACVWRKAVESAAPSP